MKYTFIALLFLSSFSLSTVSFAAPGDQIPGDPNAGSQLNSGADLSLSVMNQQTNDPGCQVCDAYPHRGVDVINGPSLLREIADPTKTNTGTK